MEGQIRFTDEGKRTLHTLRIDNQRNIKDALKELARDLSIGKVLHGRLEGLYSLIVGNYRVIYSLESEVVIVHVVGHRRNIYKIASRTDGDVL